MTERTISGKRSSWATRYGWLAIACFLLAWLVFYGIRGFDHQNANIAFLLMNALAIVFGVLWWLVRSSPSLAIRLLFLTAPVIGLAIFFQFFQFRGFSGELVPQFRWQSRRPSPLSPPPSEPLASKDVGSNLKSLESTSSFRQFLGNERTGFVEDNHLSERWDQNQPKLLWKRSIGLGWSGFAIQDGLAITMDEFDGRDCLIALDWNDGSLRWRAPLARRHYHPMGGGGPSATPTIEGKQVYAQSSTGIICSCDVDSGKILWQVDLLEKAGISQKEAELAVTWGRSGSPLLYGELLIVPFGGAMEESPAGLIALDRSSGRERWRGGSAQISYASPSMMAIQGMDQIVIVNESTVTGHNPENGSVLWSHDWPGQSNGAASVSQAVLIDASHILLSKGYGGGAEMLELTKGSSGAMDAKTKWKNASLLKTKFTSAVYREGYLYGLSDGILECVQANTGKRMWKDTRNGRLGHGQLLLVDRHLVVSAEDGRLVIGLVDPDGFRKIGEMPVLTGITWNTLAVAGNRVFMRNGEQAACVQIPTDSQP